MSPEELDKARVKEARRLWHEQGAPHPQPIEIAARLAREGWTPPDPISPRMLAAREWLGEILDNCPKLQSDIATGLHDNDDRIQDFLAGFAAAVKLAEPLVRYLEGAGRAKETLTTYRQSIGDE